MINNKDVKLNAFGLLTTLLLRCCIDIKRPFTAFAPGRTSLRKEAICSEPEVGVY